MSTFLLPLFYLLPFSYYLALFKLVDNEYFIFTLLFCVNWYQPIIPFLCILLQYFIITVYTFTDCMDLPDEVKHFKPSLISVFEIFSDRELKLLLSKADKSTLQVNANFECLIKQHFIGIC